MIPAYIPAHNIHELLRAINLLIHKHKDVKNIFEDNVKELLQAENCVTLSSGRRALYLGLKGLGIEKGDEIILPAFVTKIVPMVIREAGGTPIPVDVNLDDYNICAESVLKRISDKTKAILAVHTFGNPSQLRALREICYDKDLFLIEDAATAFGAKLDGKYVGTFGDFSIISFGIGKSISMCWGGALIYRGERLRLSKDDLTSRGTMSSKEAFITVLGSIIISNHTLYGLVGYKVKDMRVLHGYDNYKNELIDKRDISLLSYAIGVQELAGDAIKRRKETASHYTKCLNNLEKVYPPLERDNVSSVYTRYFVRVESENMRNTIIGKLKRMGIDPLISDQGYLISRTLYPSIIWDTTPNAEMLSKTLIAIPITTRLNESVLWEIFH